jgi:hypothetical protein
MKAPRNLFTREKQANMVIAWFKLLKGETGKYKIVCVFNSEPRNNMLGTKIIALINGTHES